MVPCRAILHCLRNAIALTAGPILSQNQRREFAIEGGDSLVRPALRAFFHPDRQLSQRLCAEPVEAGREPVILVQIRRW